MIKTLILLFFFHIQTYAFCQTDLEKIDSMANKMLIDKEDWAVTVTVVWPGRIEIYDSLGNQKSKDPNGTYLFSKIGNNCALQFFDRWISFDLNVQLNRSFSKLENDICNFTIDSIHKGEKEWFYPHIYKDDSLSVYGIQPNSSHAPSYRLNFMTKTSNFIISFEQVQIQECIKFLRSAKNLNYNHNINTFIFRFFEKANSFLNKQLEVEIL